VHRSLERKPLLLELGASEKPFEFDEVVAVRELGMRTVYKVLIVTGVALGILTGLFLYSYGH
jgi:hypothetical protein